MQGGIFAGEERVGRVGAAVKWDGGEGEMK